MNTEIKKRLKFVFNTASLNLRSGETDMKLTYRGNQYEASFPSGDVVESELTGKYRGQSVQFHYPRHIPVAHNPQPLKYRGVSYNHRRPEQGLNDITPLVSSEKSSVETRQGATLRLVTFEKVIDENTSKVHANHLCRLLERRRQAAIERGDLNLLRQLDLEAKHIAC